MIPERWHEVERIYQAALDCNPSLRSEFLDQACAGDTDLRREVESLLHAQGPDDRFLESGAMAVAARALAGQTGRASRGQRLGAYELIEPIGAGGMGEVWRALDPGLNRHVAIKILLPQYARDPDRLRRFELEARAAGILNHPNILAIYAIGKEQDSPYLVTELLEGTTLRQRLAAGAIPESKASEYTAQIAEGLAAAHNKRIVHRDLKPENVFLTSDGGVKILDFGLAKLLQVMPGQNEETQTASGTALGTPAYMSPEQVRGLPADHRSDIFALGVVLYEMLSGRRPFVGNSVAETMNAILTQEPPPLAKVSPSLEQIVRHCLEKEAGDRFQSARDLSFQIRSQTTSNQAPARALKARRRYLVPAAAGLVVMAVIVGLISQSNPTAKPKIASAFERVTSDSGLTTDPAISLDGKLIAYASDRGGQGNLDIWRQQLATGEAIPLTRDPFDESEPAFSPDGGSIAFRSERDGGGIYVVSAFGGGEPRLVAVKGRRPRFSPDGTQIAYWVGSWYMGHAFVAPFGGGSPTAIQPGFLSVLHPIWSPDGSHLLFLGARNPQDIPDDHYDWWIVPRAGGDAIKSEAFSTFAQQRIQNGRPSLIAPAAWVGDQVYFSAKSNDTTSLWRLTVSPETGKASGLAEQLTSGTSLEAKPSIASGDQIVYASLTENLNIWGIPIDANRGKITGELEQLTDGAHDSHTSLSADGRKLVFASTRSGNPDVWLKDLATGKEDALTATPLNEEQPEITHDGERVCYMVPEGQAFAIYSVNTRGGIPERLCDCGRPWDWSPDGKRILYLVPEGHGKLPGSPMSLAFFDLVTRQKTDFLQHPKHNLARARLSPDGRWISLVEITSPGLNRITVVSFQDRPEPETASWISITDVLALYDKPRWSPDGNHLYYMYDHDGSRCIRAQRLDPATKRPIGPALDVYHSHSARRSLINAGIRFQEISLSRDKLVFNLGEITGNIWLAKLTGKN